MLAVPDGFRGADGVPLYGPLVLTDPTLARGRKEFSHAMANNTLADDLYNKGIPGALGGVLAWIISLSPDPQFGVVILWPLEWYISLPMFVFLGVVAALAFFEVLTNINQANATTIFVLAIIAGMFWEPVIGRIVSTQTAIRRTEVEIHGRLEAVLAAVTASVAVVEESPGDDKQQYSTRADAAASDLAASALAVSPGDEEIPRAVTELLVDVGSRGNTDNQTDIARIFADAGLETVSGILPGLFQVARLDFLRVPSELATTLHDATYSVQEGTPVPVPSSDATEAIVQVLITQTSDYTIDISSPDTDLVAALFGVDTALVAVDDDSGQGAAPCIERSLDADTYYLRVSHFTADESVPEFAVTVSQGLECVGASS